MCEKAVDTCPFLFDPPPEQYMTLEISNKVISKEPSMLKQCPDRYKTQVVCDKNFYVSLPALKFVPDWFPTNKMTEKLDDSVFSNQYTVFGDIDSDIVTFFSNDIGLDSINFNSFTTEANIIQKLVH